MPFRPGLFHAASAALLFVRCQAGAEPPAAVKPKLSAPLFEKQKKLQAAVHASGEAKLAIVVDGIAHAVLSKDVGGGESGAVVFDLATVDAEALSLGCFTPGAIAKLNGAKLSEESIAKLAGFELDDATIQGLKAGAYTAALVEALRAKSAVAAVLRLLVPSAEANAELRKACGSIDYAELAKSGLRKAMIVRLTDKENQTDEQVVAQGSSVAVMLRPPKEGDQVVKGEVIGNANKVRVEVYGFSGSVVDFDTATVDAASASQPAKSFTSGLNRRLSAGQTVRVIAYLDDAELSATDYTLVETVGFDWGRVRAYFSAGATVATGEAAASRTVTAPGGATSIVPEYSWKLRSADYFVALNLDSNWFSNLRDRAARPCPQPVKEKEQLTELEEWIDEIDSGKRWKQLRNAQILAYLDQFREVLKATVAKMETAMAGKASECSLVELQRLRALPKLIEDGPLYRDMQSKADTLRAGAAGREKSGAAAAPAPAQDGKATKQKNTGPAEDPDKSTPADKKMLKRLVDEIEEALQDYRRHHFETPPAGRMFNSSFEARLGQAPVPSATALPNAASIVQSPNAGFAELNMYAPMWFQSTAWRHKDRENALFMAPIVKFSLLAAQDGPVLEAGRDKLFNHLYPAYHAGLRVGHFMLDGRRKSIAPELISFLDVTFGRFDNFRRPPLSTTPPNPDLDAVIVPTRVELQGRFKIPATPLTIGFTANVGAGRDDMRIFFGTRFDMGRLLARAIPSVD